MLSYENKFKDLGYSLIAGIDEVGRGPLAGPVVCASVVMPLDADKIIDGINDSKKLSAKKRDLLFDKIINTAISYSIVDISPKIIDEINILNATKLGMKRAVENLKCVPDILLIDAVKIDSSITQESIIKGDEKSYNIASASIIAKVYRDRLMDNFAREYPEFGFEKNKGYGTAYHIEKLKLCGECEIHRQSFIKNFKNG